MTGNKDNELREWKKKNRRRIELTDFEKSLSPEKFDATKHVAYTEKSKSKEIYRLRLAYKGEIESWPWITKRTNEGTIRMLQKMWEQTGVNFLGYSYNDIFDVTEILEKGQNSYYD